MVRLPSSLSKGIGILILGKNFEETSFCSTIENLECNLIKASKLISNTKKFGKFQTQTIKVCSNNKLLVLLKDTKKRFSMNQFRFSLNSNSEMFKYIS